LRATVGSPGTASFMLVLDRLTENLHEKIAHWKANVQRCRGKFGFFRRDNGGLEALFSERLLAAFDIARALRHLHRNKIIYRDIKVRRFEGRLHNILSHQRIVQQSHVTVFPFPTARKHWCRHARRHASL
jgi:hypothetical protein